MMIDELIERIPADCRFPGLLSDCWQDIQLQCMFLVLPRDLSCEGVDLPNGAKRQMMTGIN